MGARGLPGQAPGSFGLRATRQLVTGLTGRELRREELPAGTFGDLGQQEVLLAKTADRSVLGCMNDMASRCEHASGADRRHENNTTSTLNVRLLELSGDCEAGAR